MKTSFLKEIKIQAFLFTWIFLYPGASCGQILNCKTQMELIQAYLIAKEKSDARKIDCNVIPCIIFVSFPPTGEILEMSAPSGIFSV